MTAPSPVPVMLMIRELGIGGCERDVAKLAKSIDRSKFLPHVACFVPDGLRSEEVRAAGVPIVHIPVTSFKSWSLIDGARIMHRYLREHQIKVVHAFDVPTVILGMPVAYMSRIPAIVSAQLGRRELYDSLSHRLLRITDHLAHVVVANSQSTQQYLIDSEGIPAHRTYLCHNGVETSLFHPAVETKPTIVADAPLVIGTVCALRPEKRLDLLIQAFAQVRHLLAGYEAADRGQRPHASGVGISAHPAQLTRRLHLRTGQNRSSSLDARPRHLRHLL